MRTALSFGLMYAGVLLVSGLTDVDAITLSSLRLFNLHKLPTAAVVNVVVIATLANLLFKSALAVFVGGWHVARTRQQACARWVWGRSSPGL